MSSERYYNSNRNFELEELDLGRLLYIIYRNLFFVILFSIITGLFGFAIAVINYVPRYTATGQFIVLPAQEETAPSDILTLNKLANTYKKVLAGTRVESGVHEKLAGEIDLDSIYYDVEIIQKRNSQTMWVSIKTEDPEYSKKIVNAFLEVAPQIANEIIETGTIEVVDLAQGSENPDSDYTIVLYSLAGAVIGFVFSTFIVSIRDMFTYTIRSPRDVKQMLAVPLLGVIPEKVKGKKDKPDQLLYSVRSKNSSYVFVQAYKQVRTRIESIKNKSGHNTFVITSTFQNEGKTTFSVNVSSIFAQKNNKVLLIDCDLRKSVIYKLLNNQQNKEKNLVNVLKGGMDVHDAIQHAGGFGFDILLAGRDTEEASELLGSPEMQELILKLSTCYDYIFIDTPPTSTVTDSSIVAEFADGLIYIIKEDFATLDAIEECLANFDDTRAQVIGVVLSHSRAKR